MRRISKALVAALISALLVPLTPATAATESISPSSEITFDNQLSQSMRFDALGRAWIWNPGSNETTGPRLAIYEKVSGGWARVQTVRAKKLRVNTLRFGSDGRAFATNSRKKEIVTWRVTDSGTVRKERRVDLRGRSIPLDAFPNANGSLFVLHRNRIDEFVLPLRRNERPVRTIRGEFRYYSKLVALADGTVFVMQGDSDNTPIEVYSPSASGVSEPTRTILIDSALATLTPTDIALTPDGKVAVAYWSTGVAIYDSSVYGSSVTPATWYPQSAPLVNLHGVDFGPNGIMGLADYLQPTAVKVYFESMCAPRPEARC